MNILGIGNLELVWILLLALVLLGPGRMVDAARTVGKFWREAQHMLRAAADAATVSLDAPPPRSASREPLPAPEDAVARGGSGEESPEPVAPDAAGAAEAQPGASGVPREAVAPEDAVARGGSGEESPEPVAPDAAGAAEALPDDRGEPPEAR